MCRGDNFFLYLSQLSNPARITPTTTFLENCPCNIIIRYALDHQHPAQGSFIAFLVEMNFSAACIRGSIWVVRMSCKALPYFRYANVFMHVFNIIYSPESSI